MLKSYGGLSEELVSFIAEQLDVPTIALADYAGREQTMTDHARELAGVYGLRAAARTDIPFMIEAAAKAQPCPKQQSRRYAATAKDVGRLMRLFQGTIDALSTALNNGLRPGRGDRRDHRLGELAQGTTRSRSTRRKDQGGRTGGGRHGRYFRQVGRHHRRGD
ncbi:DUF4158 domain-containing protein [Rhizobium mongolense]|uniref:DUF4158 domain-containing protein n=1 Tax=Rhizobium mongolense TaxID=57676 RepID=UPI000A066EF6